MVGTVKNVVLEKRFLFVRDQHGTDRFCHATAVSPDVNFDRLQRGDEVEFDPEEGDRGPRACNLRLVRAING